MLTTLYKVRLMRIHWKCSIKPIQKCQRCQLCVITGKLEWVFHLCMSLMSTGKDKTYINPVLICYHYSTYVIKGDSGFTAAADRHSHSRRMYFTVALLAFCGFSFLGDEASHNVDEFLLSSRASTQLKSVGHIC